LTRAHKGKPALSPIRERAVVCLVFVALFVVAFVIHGRDDLGRGQEGVAAGFFEQSGERCVA
jgi:hypothetical protein